MSLLFPDGWCGQACPHVFTEDDSLGSLTCELPVPVLCPFFCRVIWRLLMCALTALRPLKRNCNILLCF